MYNPSLITSPQGSEQALSMTLNEVDLDESDSELLPAMDNDATVNPDLVQYEVPSGVFLPPPPPNTNLVRVAPAKQLRSRSSRDNNSANCKFSPDVCLRAACAEESASSSSCSSTRACKAWSTNRSCLRISSVTSNSQKASTPATGVLAPIKAAS